MPEEETHRYLDPKVLDSLGNIAIGVNALVEGILAGPHRSPHQGGEVEFSEYIEYSPGHELRHIDWKVYAKSDRYYVKQFEQETNLRVYLAMDGSGSMNFQSEDAPLTKMRYASYVAATLAYLFIRQGDAVGALAFDEDAQQYLPAVARRTHLEELFALFDGLRGQGTTAMHPALSGLGERARSGCMFLIFSDMLSADEELLNFLRVLRARRYEIVIFHVIDPAEIDLPFEGLTLFEGLEEEDALLVDPDDLRQAYTEAMRGHLDMIERQCREGNLEYIRFLTTDPIEEVALRFLRTRSPR